jgi:tetratricopeptide (TPR) repeat protein
MAHAEARGLERQDRTPTADFLWRVESDLGLEGLDVTRVSFRNSSSWQSARIRECTWEFGDGQVRTGKRAEHVFLESGVYPVKMTLALDTGEKAERVQRVRVHPWGTLIREGKPRSDDYLWEFLTLVQDYDFSAATPEACLNGARMAGYAGRSELEFRALKGAFQRKPPLADADTAKEALLYAGLLEGRVSRFRDAADLYLRVAREGIEPSDRIEGYLRAAEVYLYYLDAPDAAEALLLTVKPLAGARYRRWADLRLIDVDLARGRAAEAAGRYQALGEDPFGEDPLQNPALVRGDLQTRFYAYLETGETGAAKDALREWEQARPACAANGEITYARALLMMRLAQWQSAACQFQWTLDLAPESHLAPKALIGLARCHEQRGEEEEAKACRDRLRRDFPLEPN